MLAALPGVNAVDVLDTDAELSRFALSMADARAAAPAVAQAISARGWALFGLEPERRDLEALFRAVSGTATPSNTDSVQTDQEAVHV